jgi:hypothetical protein
MTRYIQLEWEKCQKELARYWPVSSEPMAEYLDGTHAYQDSDGDFIWQKENGLWHRDEDRPAWINTHRDLIWYQNGLQHRDNDKPAFIGADGRLEWQQNGWLHRDGDRPAVIYADGHLRWYQNNQLHRTSGPAVIFPSGTLEWWQNGEDITKQVRAWLARRRWSGTPEQIIEFQLRFC